LNKGSKLVVVSGIVILIIGIILEIIIQTLAGSYLELRGLEAKLVVIGLMVAGLITIGVAIMYEFSVRKFKGVNRS